MGAQIILMRGKVQLIIGQTLHHQPPGLRLGNGNGHIRFAPRQVKDARQGDDLNLQPRVILRQLGADLRQKIVRATVWRADAQLPGQVPGTRERLFSLA